MERGFTLVIPLYNKVNVFRNTLDSVLNNHGEYPFKCLIIDDDSTDGSSEIAIEYDRKCPDIFQYIKKTHRGHPGPSFARNTGIRLAETEYIGFLDCDDEICPGFIDRACTFLDEHPEYSMYCNGNIENKVDQDGNILSFDVKYTTANIDNMMSFVHSMIHPDAQVHFCGSVYRTDIVNEIMFNDVYGEDIDFMLRYYYYHPNIYIDDTTCQSIIHNTHYSDSNAWYRVRHPEYPPFYEILNTLKDEIPDLPYTFWFDENEEIYYQVIR